MLDIICTLDRTDDDNESAQSGGGGGVYNKYLLGRHNLRVRANQIFLLQI